MDNDAVLPLADPRAWLVPDLSAGLVLTAVLVPVGMAYAVALAGMLAILSGALGCLAGLLRLGFIAALIAKPIRYGYLNGIALTVLVLASLAADVTPPDTHTTSDNVYPEQRDTILSPGRGWGFGGAAWLIATDTVLRCRTVRSDPSGGSQ